MLVRQLILIANLTSGLPDWQLFPSIDQIAVSYARRYSLEEH